MGDIGNICSCSCEKALETSHEETKRKSRALAGGTLVTDNTKILIPSYGQGCKLCDASLCMRYIIRLPYNLINVMFFFR